jgi:hypothetical protein
MLGVWRARRGALVLRAGKRVTQPDTRAAAPQPISVTFPIWACRGFVRGRWCPQKGHGLGFTHSTETTADNVRRWKTEAAGHFGQKLSVLLVHAVFEIVPKSTGYP